MLSAVRFGHVALTVSVFALVSGCLGAAGGSDHDDSLARRVDDRGSSDGAASASEWAQTGPPGRDTTAASTDPGVASDSPTTVGPAAASEPAASYNIGSVLVLTEMPNVYHEAFRRPDLTAHPSTYVPGYPADAIPLHLTLDAGSFEEARRADLDTWDGLEAQRLYYIPGTVFIGLRGEAYAPHIDEASAHGTGVANHAAGLKHGASNRTALVIHWHALVDSEVIFAMENRWIDARSSSVSWLWPYPPGLAAEFYRREFVAAGGLDFNSVPNSAAAVIVPFGCGVQTTLFCPSSGPPWIVAIGRWDDSLHAIGGRGPMDVAGPQVPCAAAESVDMYDDDCRGTSFATPFVAGLVMDVLASVRERWGWQECGQFLACTDDSNLWTGTGALSDGRLTNQELLSAVYMTAATAPRHEFGLAMDVHNYTDQGWGLASKDSAEHALDVLWGSTDAPERPNIEYWWGFHQDLRHAYWDIWPDVWPGLFTTIRDTACLVVQPC